MFFSISMLDGIYSALEASKDILFVLFFFFYLKGEHSYLYYVA